MTQEWKTLTILKNHLNKALNKLDIIYKVQE